MTKRNETSTEDLGRSIRSLGLMFLAIMPMFRFPVWLFLLFPYSSLLPFPEINEDFFSASIFVAIACVVAGKYLENRSLFSALLSSFFPILGALLFGIFCMPFLYLLVGLLWVILLGII